MPAGGWLTLVPRTPPAHCNRAKISRRSSWQRGAGRNPGCGATAAKRNWPAMAGLNSADDRAGRLFRICSMRR